MDFFKNIYNIIAVIGTIGSCTGIFYGFYKKLDKRIKRLEEELAKALDKANNNKLHCPQCGGDVKINYTLTGDAGKTMYDCNCKNCDFKGIITK